MRLRSSESRRDHGWQLQSLQSAMYPSLTLGFGSTGSLDQLNAKFRPTANGTVVKSTVGYLNDDDTQPVIGRSFAPEYRTIQGYSYGSYANLSLRFTLFNGGQVRRAVKNAEIEEKIASLGTEKLKLSLENDLLTGMEQYELRKQLAIIAGAQTNLSTNIACLFVACCFSAPVEFIIAIYISEMNAFKSTL